MTALETAQDELHASMAPHTSEFIGSFSPQAALLWLWQSVLGTQEYIVKFIGDTATDLNEESDAANGIMNGLAAAMVGSTHALVALGVLPVEAEEALVGG